MNAFQAHCSGPEVPAQQNGSYPGPCFGYNFPGTLPPPGYINNGPYYPTYGSHHPNFNPANAFDNCNMNTLMSVPPPGYHTNGNINSTTWPLKPPVPVPFSENGFVRPQFGTPSYPTCVGSIPNPATVDCSYPPPTNYGTLPSPNSSLSQLPMSFNVPPPPIPPEFLKRSDNRAKFSEFNHQRKSKSTSFHCQSCDRDFYSEDKYKQHLSEHVICGLEGCKFTAHAGIVEKHIAMQHRSGLFNRIVKGNTPEEIDKWISERKKQYPTKDRVETKQAQRKEMHIRGERYAEPKKKFNDRFSKDQRRPNGFNKFDSKRKTSFNRRGFKTKTPTDESEDKSSTAVISISEKKSTVKSEELDDCIVRTLPPFRGTAYYLNPVENEETEVNVEVDSFVCDDSITSKNYLFDDFDSDAEISERSANAASPATFVPDKDVIVETIIDCDFADSSDLRIPDENSASEVACANKAQNSSPADRPSIMSSLDLLKAYNCSDDEDESDGNDPTTEPKKQDDNCVNEDSEPEEFFRKIDTNTEIAIPDVDVTNSHVADVTDSKKNRKRKRHKEVAASDQPKTNDEKLVLPKSANSKRFRRPTLLEKLLSNEIKHERNVILQCVRYVVENNFFDAAQSK